MPRSRDDEAINGCLGEGLPLIHLFDASGWDGSIARHSDASECGCDVLTGRHLVPEEKDAVCVCLDVACASSDSHPVLVVACLKSLERFENGGEGTVESHEGALSRDGDDHAHFGDVSDFERFSVDASDESFEVESIVLRGLRHEGNGRDLDGSEKVATAFALDGDRFEAGLGPVPSQGLLDGWTLLGQGFHRFR